MKKRINRIFGVGLVVVLLSSLLVLAAPVSAGTLSFTEEVNEDIPSTTGKVVQAGLDIYDIAVAGDGETIYAVGWEPGGTKIYKSVNAGDTWSKVDDPSGISGNITLVAVAPDEPDIVVVVGGASGSANYTTGYVSTNGGSTFSSLGTITGASNAEQIYDVAISALSGSERFIACAGEGDGAAALYYFNLGASAPAWHDAANYSGTWTSFGTTTDRFLAVAFSPNFPSDQVMVVLSADDTTGTSTDGYARFHIASYNQKAWDSAVFTDYPVALETTGNLTVNKADIALDPEYLGGDDTTRIAFVGMSANASGAGVGGIYRLKDTSLKDMKDASIASVAWDGTNLAAGDYANNNVYRSADALASTFTVSTSRSNKEIGIDDTGANDQVIVRWCGTDLVGVKQGASSAFGRSADYGKTWNDISLIDTTLALMEDVWVSPDGSVVYLVSSNSTDAETSVWRYASSWTRVLTLGNAAGYIVRAADSDADAVYVADVGDKAMYYSTDGGVEKWTQRTNRYTIADLAVQDAEVAYVANSANDEVSKTTNGGFTWGSDVDTKAAGGNCATITLIADDQLLVGTTTGYVAYSSDGNESWAKIATQLASPGNAQVTASGLADGDYIYAATATAGSPVERWEIGQDGTKWKDLAAPVSTSNSCYGLMLDVDVLYGIVSDGTNSYLIRTIEPTTATPSSGKWSAISSADEAYTRTPSAMRLSRGSTIIWVIDNTSGNAGLWTLTDTLGTDVAIALISPADGYQNPINPVSGYSQDISFKWTKPTTGSIAYEVRIYAADASTILTTGAKAATDVGEPNLLIGPDQSDDQALQYAPGTTYYWSVRTSSPVYSPWSEKRAFSIETLGAQVPNILSPENGASITATSPAFSWSPIAQTEKYEFQLALSPSFSKPLASETVTTSGLRPLVKLDTGMTYFWRVRALEPVVGEWSAISNFTVEGPPPEAPPPVEIVQTPPPVIQIPAAPPANIIEIPPAPPPPAQIAPGYIWAIIIIGAVLVIAVIVLIVRTRRTV